MFTLGSARFSRVIAVRTGFSPMPMSNNTMSMSPFLTAVMADIVSATSFCTVIDALPSKASLSGFATTLASVHIKTRICGSLGALKTIPPPTDLRKRSFAVQGVCQMDKENGRIMSDFRRSSAQRQVRREYSESQEVTACGLDELRRRFLELRDRECNVFHRLRNFAGVSCDRVNAF